MQPAPLSLSLAAFATLRFLPVLQRRLSSLDAMVPQWAMTGVPGGLSLSDSDSSSSSSSVETGDAEGTARAADNVAVGEAAVGVALVPPVSAAVVDLHVTQPHPNAAIR